MKTPEGNPADTPGDRLMIARYRAGYKTAAGFAQAHGIPQSTYSLHEGNKRKMSPHVAARYAESLGNCTPSWILYGEGSTPNYLIKIDGVNQRAILSPQLKETISEAFSMIYERMVEFYPPYYKDLSETGYVPAGYSDGGHKGVAEVALDIVLSVAEKWDPTETPVESFATLCLETMRVFEEQSLVLLRSIRETLAAISKDRR